MVSRASIVDIVNLREKKMRVLLVNPFCPLSEMPSPPLGLACLAAAMEEAGIEVKILDLVVSAYGPEMLDVLVKDFRPQIVGLTAVSMTFNHAVSVVADIKAIDPEIITIMGGPHVTFCASETLTQFAELDVVVCGEGERTIVELAQSVQNGADWKNIRGIVFRQGSGICVTEPRTLIQDLDSLPRPARHLLPLGRYRALGMSISLTTSRGCPFQCIYCVGRKMVGAKVRYRSASQIVDELEYLNRLNFNQINIADDLFTANKKHCTAVCDEIIKRGLNLKWTSFARVDTISEKLLAKMKSAGCKAVSFGIESGNPGILKTIKKGITLTQVIKAVELCTRTGITAHGSFLLGLPGETPQTLQETLVFSQKLKDKGLVFGFHLLAPFPGTEVREKCAAYGLKILTDDWSQYHANRAIVETATVDRQMLDDIVSKWEKEFDAFLGDIQERMQTNEATTDERWQLENLERVVVIYELMLKSVIESKGGWGIGRDMVSQGDALQGLIARVQDQVDAKTDKVANALAYSVEQRYLTYHAEKGYLQWQWI